MNRYRVLIFSALMLWGCHGNPKTASSDNNNSTDASDTTKHAQVKLPTPDKGVIVDTIHCADDASQRYSIYLPTYYTADKKWPVVFFFDPHGAGNLPLRLYKDLAEKYGYVIAGTYNSKNGMQMDESAKAAQAMMQDVSQRVSVDNARFNTFGFSGGARVACSVALNGGIANVVACGGGFPQNNPQIGIPFSIIMYVGEKDFNYVELKNLDQQLDNSPLTHQLVVFHGKHQWPLVKDIEQAFQWMDMVAMRGGYMTKNDSIIKSVENELVKEADNNGIQEKSIHQYFVYKKILNFLRGLANTDKYLATVQSMQGSAQLSKYQKDEQASEVDEAKEQQLYIQYLSDKDGPWWQDRIKDLRQVIKLDSTMPAALRAQRLLSFLSLAVYMGASRSISTTDDGATAHFLETYALIDPTNPEHSYLFADLYARENNPDKAMSSLQDAVRLGFTDLRRLESDAELNSIKDKPEFKALVKKIQSAPPKLDVTQ